MSSERERTELAAAPALAPGFSAGEATRAEQHQAQAQTFPFWGGSHTLESYRERTAVLQATAWGAAHYRFWVLRDPAGEVVSSCKAYDMPLWIEHGGAVVPAVGIGGVFTPPERRRQGHAAAMLRALLADRAARGMGLASLFSDIEPEYYRRLGFVTLPVAKLATVPDRLPPDPADAVWREATAAELPDLARVARATARRFDLAYARDVEYLAHLSLIYRQPFRWLERGGRRLGFLLAVGRDSELELLEWGHEEPEASALLLGAARRLLPAGCTRVRGWLPADDPAVGAAFDPLPEEDAIWMVARLDPAAPDVDCLATASVHAWSDDHF